MVARTVKQVLPAAKTKNSKESVAVTRPLDLLDDVIHQKVRLGIMSCLLVVSEAEFSFLKSALMVSDGNLSTHLSSLEAVGYVSSSKVTNAVKPIKNRYSITDDGRLAFTAYVAALESLVRPSG